MICNLLLQDKECVGSSSHQFHLIQDLCSAKYSLVCFDNKFNSFFFQQRFCFFKNNCVWCIGSTNDYFRFFNVSLPALLAFLSSLSFFVPHAANASTSTANKIAVIFFSCFNSLPFSMLLYILQAKPGVPLINIIFFPISSPRNPR